MPQETPQPSRRSEGIEDRHYSVSIDQLRGLSAGEVQDQLGKPGEKQRGRLWYCDDLGLGLQEDDSGKLAKVPVIRPLPEKIEPGAPYTQWFYPNVMPPRVQDGPQTWVVYLAGRAKAGDRVRDVYQYDTGAVF